MAIYDEKCIFISKVYRILIMQLIVMTSIVLASQLPFFDFYFKYIITNISVSIVLAFISNILLLTLYGLLNDDGIHTLLAIFTISISNIVACSTYFLSPSVVIISLISTLLIVMLLNYHASHSDYLYSVYYSLLVSILMTMTISSIIGWYMGIYFDSMVISLFDAVIFSLFIVCVTQYLTRDNELINHPVGHVIMAMTLFLDVVGLFLRILLMLQKMPQEKIQNKWK